MIPCLQRFLILFRKNSWDRFTFCVHISRNRPPESGWCIVSVTCRHFDPVWRRAPKICRGVCHLSRVKFRPNRFRFSAAISENGFRTTAVCASACNSPNNNLILQSLYVLTFTKRNKCYPITVSVHSVNSSSRCFRSRLCFLVRHQPQQVFLDSCGVIFW